jgi:cytoskeletal protein CcmA (bactofilin family)
MARADDSGRSGGREISISIVATGMRIVGELATDGVLKVEGTVEGSIRADREVLVARGGVIEGDVYTRQAIVGGRVVGSIFADDRVEVQENSMVQGDIITKKLIVSEGGEVNGNVQMGEPKALEQGANVAAKRERSPAPPAMDPAPALETPNQPYA